MNKSAGGTANDAPPKANPSRTTSVADIALDDGSQDEWADRERLMRLTQLCRLPVLKRRQETRCHDPHAQMSFLGPNVSTSGRTRSVLPADDVIALVARGLCRADDFHQPSPETAPH